MLVDAHQHFWTEPLVAALAARRQPPLIRHDNALTVLHCDGELPLPRACAHSLGDNELPRAGAYSLGDDDELLRATGRRRRAEHRVSHGLRAGRMRKPDVRSCARQACARKRWTRRSRSSKPETEGGANDLSPDHT